MKLARKPQIEIRKVDENGNVGMAALDFPNYFLKESIDARKVPHDLGQPHDGDVVRIDHEIASRVAHGVAAYAKELGLLRIAAPAQLRAQRLDQPRAIHVSGGFAGREEDAHV